MYSSAVDLVLAVRTGYVQDARTHACQWGLLDGQKGVAKLVKPSTSSRQVILGSLYGG